MAERPFPTDLFPGLNKTQRRRIKAEVALRRAVQRADPPRPVESLEPVEPTPSPQKNLAAEQE